MATIAPDNDIDKSTAIDGFSLNLNGVFLTTHIVLLSYKV